MKDIEEQARAILLRARARAEQLIAEAQTQGEIIKAKAHAEGVSQGKAAGLAQGTEEGRKSGHEQALAEHRAKFSEVIAALSAAASELNASRQKLESEAAGEVLKLAIAIARRVTHRQASADPSVVSDNLANAMKLAVHASDVRIAIHPTQGATLADALPRLKLRWPALEHVELIEDAQVAPGGCRIVTTSGEVDADLDQQIDRIAAELVPAAGLVAATPASPGVQAGKRGDAGVAATD